MSVSPETRELVRQRANRRCEYCGVDETDAGGELTIDHYRPRAYGGSDDASNLIYACGRCNIYKHDYWPEGKDAPRLWNPRQEPFTAHFIELPGGTWKSRTPTGTLTLRQLRLNRPQLVAHRQRHREAEDSRHQLGLYQGIVAVQSQLLKQQSALEDLQTELLQELRELFGQLLDARR